MYCKSFQTNQLEFLLSKAEEYSGFISKDLEDLQQAMAERAQAKQEKSEKRKKRKGSEGKEESSKKKSKASSGEALKSAVVKDAATRASTKKAIFVQPTNLAKGCNLKDYQLEGVRWLASLFENGVSGILADEVCRKHCYIKNCAPKPSLYFAHHFLF
jgi:ATP-dependent DNA helicase